MLAAFRIHESYPWYQGWAYDRDAASDPFVLQIVAGLERNPDFLKALSTVQATIYPCKNLGDTHLRHSLIGALVHVATTPALCDPLRGEIVIGREYTPDRKTWVDTVAPDFVVAHELAHILDSRLGRIIDPHGEDPPVPASLLDPYALAAYEQDLRLDVRREFTERAGLLAEETKPGRRQMRHNQTEILCDMLAHVWTGHDPETAQGLIEKYPSLSQVAALMLYLSTDTSLMRRYAELAKSGPSFEALVLQLTGTSQPAPLLDLKGLVPAIP